MLQTQAAGLERGSGGGQRVGQGASEVDPAGGPVVVLIRCGPHIGGDGRGAVGGVVAGTVGAFDQPDGGEFTLAYSGEDFGEDFDGEGTGQVGGDGGGEFGAEGVEQCRLRSEPGIEHVCESTAKGQLKAHKSDQSYPQTHLERPPNISEGCAHEPVAATPQSRSKMQPGFRMPAGSKAALIRRCSASLAGSSSAW